MLAGLEISDDQKAKLGEIQKEFGPKLLEAMKAMDGILTPEQKQARAEAGKAARDAGKKGKEMADAVEAALKLSDDQKAKFTEARKQMGEIEKGLRAKVTEVLTAEQKAKLQKKPAKAPKN